MRNGWFSAPIVQGMATIVAVLVLYSLLEAPFSLYRTFVIEARFGFNKMTFRLYLLDALKGILIGAILGLPLLFGVLWLMERMGDILVAVCVAGMGGVQPADPVHLPVVHRAAVQQILADAG